MTVSEIRDSLKWEKERACHVLVSASLLISSPALIKLTQTFISTLQDTEAEE